MDPSVVGRTKAEAAEFDMNYAQVYEQSDTAARQDKAQAFIDQVKGTTTQPAAAAVNKPTGRPTGDFVGSVAGGAAKVGTDVLVGGLQSPRHIIRGAVKGVNSMIGLVDGIMDLAPTLSILDEGGKLSYPRITTMHEDDVRSTKRANRKLAEAGKAERVDYTKPPQLPNLDPSLHPTVTGDVIETISQFVTGFGAAGKIASGLKAVGATGGANLLTGSGVIPSVTKGALADLLAFESHEQRLSDVVQSVPALSNPVTEWLAGDSDDGALEAKLKQAVEGSVGGALGEALFRGIKFIKKGKEATEKMATAGIKPDDFIGDHADNVAGAAADDSTVFSSLGDADFEDIIIKKNNVELRKFHKTTDILEANDAYAETVAKKVIEAKGVTGRIKAKDVATPKLADDITPEIQINFARIDGEDDVKILMEKMANDPDLIGSVQTARRGTQTTEATLEGAKNIDGFDELLTRRTGEAFNDQQIAAARKVYYDTTEKLLEVARKAAQPLATDADQFMFRKMIAIHHAVQKDVLGARAEAGRALRAWAIPLGGESRISDVKNIMNEFGGSEATQDLAKRLTSMANAGTLNTSQINAVTRGSAVARTSKALISAWQLGLLTSPRTHIVNFVSNIATGLTLGAERYAAAVVGDGTIQAREATEYFVGYVGSIKEALVNAGHALKTGETGIGFGKIDLPPIPATSMEVLDPEGKAGMFSKALSAWGGILNKTVGGGLAAGDEFAKTLLYRAQVRALVTRRGINQGLRDDALTQFISDGVSDPDAYIKSDAIEFANYGTYTNALEGAAGDFSRIIHKVPILRIIFPFVRTPTNIFKFTFSRTPLALLSEQVRENLSAGGVKRSMQLAKLGTGASVMMLGADFSINGLITGSGPRDNDTRMRLLSTGWRPYSMKINGEYYSYARLEPFATWLGMTADMTEILTNYSAYDVREQHDVDELATAAVVAISNQVVGKTFLQGIADITQVLTDSKRYGDSYLRKMAASFLTPAIVADIERAVSPETEVVFNMMDAVKARIPGLSDSVPKRFNVYGEVMKNYTPEEGLAGVPERLMTMFNPILSSDPDADDQKLDQFFLSTGINGPHMPAKTQTFADPRSFGQVKAVIDLRDYPEIYSRSVELRGEVRLPSRYGMRMKEYLTALVDRKLPESNVFFDMIRSDRDEQSETIHSIVSSYDKEIRRRLVTEYPVLLQEIIEKKDEQRASGANAGGGGLIRKKPFP